jgi:hypothetical protein
MRIRNAIFGAIGVVWGGAMVVVGFKHGLNYETSYEVGRVVAYLLGWVLIGAGIAVLRPGRDRDLDLY